MYKNGQTITYLVFKHFQTQMSEVKHIFCLLIERSETLWWVDLGGKPDAHQAALLPSLFKKTAERKI